MRSFKIAAALMAMLAFGAVSVADHHGDKEHGGTAHGDTGHGKSGEMGYFDDHNCTICKEMGKIEGLTESMHWETHKVENGMVMVAVAPKDKLDDYRQACKACHETAEEVMAGKVAGARMCGFCQDFGGLMAAGAKMQEVKTSFGGITIVTSADPAVVEKIHAMADRAEAEIEKLAAAAG